MLLSPYTVFQTNPLMALILAQSSENETVEVLYRLFKSLNERNESPTHIFGFIVNTCVLG